MKLLLTAVSLPLALLTAAGAVTPHIAADDLKCGPTNQTEPHYILDGVYVAGPEAPEGAVMPEVDRADIVRIDVLCFDPVRRVLQKGTGEPAVLITTKQFMATLHEDMESVVAAQDAFRAKHGSFAAAMSDLDVEIVTPGLDVSITTSRAGWSATAAGDLLIISCHVYAGAVKPPAESLVEREPACATLPRFAP